MTKDVLDRIDPQCPEINAFCVALDAEANALGLTGEKGALFEGEKTQQFASAHLATCSRCRSYRRGNADGRSAVWGGATLGFVIGAIAGLFTESFWQTVFYGVLIGGALGGASELLARGGNLFRRE